ncbi:MAG: riboflavin biosynthesis protein RibF [Anaerolineales bacterium]|nr:MAG: riboflavin biosynthesis protein RibF [Anaerolineales bacterium]
MQHIHHIDQLSLESCSLTIGSFDGVHIGHQALIKELVAQARESDEAAVVLTFFPHPSVVLRGRKPAFYINTPDEKADLLGKLGVDVVVTQPFDLDLSRVSAEDFLSQLCAQSKFHHLWVGLDFALGHHRRGDRFFLEQEGKVRGFEVHVFEPVLVSGETVSSTRVREALRSGDVARVEQYLGRPFGMPGRVVRGAGRGRGLGFPTANLEIWEERAFPRTGVYACMAEVDGQDWKAVTNIGIRPTFDLDEVSPIIEAHLLGYSGDLYGKDIQLTFIARLRDERRFPNPQALMERIQIDIQRAEEILEGRSEGRQA